jgi:hypothetical protein
VISGGYDIPADQADLRVTLAMTGAISGLPPEIRIFAAGPPDRMTRNVDLSALSSWLAIKRIDRETRKLQSLEQEAKPPVLPASRPATDSAPIDRPGGDATPAARPDAPATPVAKPGASSQPSETAPAKPDQPAIDQPATSAVEQPVTAPALVPLPDSDPRRAPPPKPRVTTPKPVPPPTSELVSPRETGSREAAPRERLAPLPPPLEIKPAPGDARPSRPRPPLVLTPPNNSRAAY